MKPPLLDGRLRLQQRDEDENREKARSYRGRRNVQPSYWIEDLLSCVVIKSQPAVDGALSVGKEAWPSPPPPPPSPGQRLLEHLTPIINQDLCRGENRVDGFRGRGEEGEEGQDGE
ncbi:hypothetical protein EYF80_023485 [Liparis tanakae]|uniref:Uncharacterized protein n=1 Tax=Liparis tanakae TaxID=230148 RepID=A0A4Z2HKY4_9TELE|nr:hypothetical protein EYF80_023485 [Liparis tanakae]